MSSTGSTLASTTARSSTEPLPQRPGVAGRGDDVARTYLLAGGFVYLVVWVHGLVVDKAADAKFVPVDRADDWLHLGLGIGVLVLASALSADPRRTPPTETRR